MGSQMLMKVHSLFGDARLRKSLLRLRLPLGLICVILIVAGARREWFLPGLLVSAVGALLQAWCFASIKTSKELADQGLYALVRNPMYLARFLLILGALLLTGCLWAVAALVPLYYFYMINRVKREERKLAEVFGEPYHAYCREVHRFVPAFRRVPLTKLRVFRWDCFRRNHGATNLAAVALFYLVCFLRVSVFAQ